MTTENSGEAVCVCGRKRDDVWDAENGIQSWARHDCENAQEHAAIGCHDFQPAPENNDPMVGDRVRRVAKPVSVGKKAHKIVLESVAGGPPHQTIGMGFRKLSPTLRTSAERSDDDRIQEARTALITYVEMFGDRVLPNRLADVIPRIDTLIARVRESVEEEQREKYQELVKAARDAKTFLETRFTPTPGHTIHALIDHLDAALSSIEIKGETSG